MVATFNGRRITHQIRFNEGWCKGEDSRAAGRVEGFVTARARN
jgi:hypothetical protein